VLRRVQCICGEAEAPLAPARDGFAQRRNAECGRIDRQLIKVVRQCLGNEVRRAMLRLANRQRDGTLVGRRLCASEQATQLLEGVWVQQIQGVVHGCSSFRMSAANAPHS